MKSVYSELILGEKRKNKRVKTNLGFFFFKKKKGILFCFIYFLMQTRCRLFSQSQSALCFIWQTSSVAIINSVTQSNSNGNSCIFKTENPNLHLDTHSEPNKNIHYTPLIASKTQSSSIRTRLLQSHMLWS